MTTRNKRRWAVRGVWRNMPLPDAELRWQMGQRIILQAARRISSQDRQAEKRQGVSKPVVVELN